MVEDGGRTEVAETVPSLVDGGDTGACHLSDLSGGFA
jgi:hypothetical protein